MTCYNLKCINRTPENQCELGAEPVCENVVLTDEKTGVKPRKFNPLDLGNDGFAIMGYEFAQCGGHGELPDFKDEIDLLMFNAGIVQANNGTSKIVSIDERWVEQRSQTSDKELGIICNH